ncbi:MAG TPA: hypothetical protein VKT29_11720 [Terriglobales bacterium]|nr:hypothetical protein [Terriglobales bacterium]
MGGTLRSWKEIARHLGASVRTAQRWEREFHLPVRRLEARHGATVFAYPAELDSWLRTHSQSAVPLVQDSYFRTVFMDSQFPSLVIDDVPRILAANFAAGHLVGATDRQLLGEKLERVLLTGGCKLAGWEAFLRCGACFGQANLRCGDGSTVGVEFVVKRFAPGLHVASVLSVGKAWASRQLRCRTTPEDFSFHMRPGSSLGLTDGPRKVARIGVS